MAHAHKAGGAPAPPHPHWPHATAPEPAHRGWAHFAWILDQTTGFLFVATLLVAPGVLLVATQQGQDLLQAVVDGLADGGRLFDRTLFWLFAGGAFLGLQAWFWTRWIVEWRFGPRAIWPRDSRYIVWAPRVLGLLPFVFLAAGFGVIHATDVRLWILIAVGAAFAAFVLSRAWIEDKLRDAAARLAQPKPAASRALFASLRLGHDIVLWGSIGLAVAGLVAFSGWPVAPAQHFGPAGVVLLGVALIIPLVTPLVVWGKSHAVAVVPALLALAMLFSLWDDNHHVRVTDRCAQACGREGVEAAFVRWRKALPADGPAVEPIIFVASQGGASRAGYWTADAMALLEEQTGGRFSRHVFAISSVSGGTLGAAAFLAAIHDQPQLATRGRLRDRLEAFVAQDYLSPALGGLLFPDLLQRFVPVPFLPDRGTALERGWEAGWRKACPSTEAGCRPDRMGRDFLSLWSDPAAGWLPILMVGGATEETGRPLLTSSADFGAWNPDARRGDGVFVEAGDFHRATQRDVRLSTAILNGARFPYISPAGTMDDGIGQHVVDGGYFDAAGVETIRQLAQRLFDPSHPLPAPAAGERAVKLKPVYLLLLNGEPAELSKKKGPRHDRFAQDLWGPVRGLYHSRSAHGERLIANLDEGRPASPDAPTIGADTAPVVIPLQVCHNLAMDWALSTKMTRVLKDDLERDQPGCPNATNLKQLRDLLAAPSR